MGAPPIPLDRVTKSLTVVDHAEHDIHEGRSFKAFFQSIAPLPTAIGAETAIGFLTPPAATNRIHMIAIASADDESTFQIREGPTITDDQGTDLNTFNRDRDAGIVTTLLTNEAPPSAGTITRYNVAEAAAADLSGGVSLHSERLAIGGAAPFGSIINSQSRAEHEWLLAADTEYVIILTNLTINDTIHEILLNWSEEPPLSIGV